MKDADGGWRVRSQGFLYSFCFRFVLWKLYSLAINRVYYFYYSISFLKEVRMNKVLCLKFLYQKARWKKPQIAQIWLTHSKFAGWGPRTPPLLSTRSLTVRNFKKAQATPLVRSYQTRIRVEAYKERGRRSTIVPAAGKVGGEVFFIN